MLLEATKEHQHSSSESTKLMYTLEVVLSKSPLPKTGVQALFNTITMKALMPCQLSIREASLAFSDHLKEAKTIPQSREYRANMGPESILQECR